MMNQITGINPQIIQITNPPLDNSKNHYDRQDFQPKILTEKGNKNNAPVIEKILNRPRVPRSIDFPIFERIKTIFSEKFGAMLFKDFTAQFSERLKPLLSEDLKAPFSERLKAKFSSSLSVFLERFRTLSSARLGTPDPRFPISGFASIKDFLQSIRMEGSRPPYSFDSPAEYAIKIIDSISEMIIDAGLIINAEFQEVQASPQAQEVIRNMAEQKINSMKSSVLTFVENLMENYNSLLNTSEALTEDEIARAKQNVSTMLNSRTQGTKRLHQALGQPVPPVHSQQPPVSTIPAQTLPLPDLPTSLSPYRFPLDEYSKQRNWFGRESFKDKKGGLKFLLHEYGYSSMENFLASQLDHRPSNSARVQREPRLNPKEETARNVKNFTKERCIPDLQRLAEQYRGSIAVARPEDQAALVQAGIHAIRSRGNQFEKHIESAKEKFKSLMKDSLRTVRFQGQTRWNTEGPWPFTQDEERWERDWLTGAESASGKSRMQDAEIAVDAGGEDGGNAGIAALREEASQLINELSSMSRPSSVTPRS